MYTYLCMHIYGYMHAYICTCIYLAYFWEAERTHKLVKVIAFWEGKMELNDCFGHMRGKTTSPHSFFFLSKSDSLKYNIHTEKSIIFIQKSTQIVNCTENEFSQSKTLPWNKNVTQTLKPLNPFPVLNHRILTKGNSYAMISNIHWFHLFWS